MKKLLMAMVLFAFPAVALTGCSSSAPQEVQGTSDEDSSMNAQQQQEYEEAMRGGGGSTPPGN